jgi:hypothetical protein
MPEGSREARTLGIRWSSTYQAKPESYGFKLAMRRARVYPGF